jgi:hypothetical protein
MAITSTSGAISSNGMAARFVLMTYVPSAAQGKSNHR